MKVRPQDVGRHLAALDPAVSVILLHGPDGGLVQERARRLAVLCVGATPDPFQVTALNGSGLAADPARLVDEAMQMSLTGGRRLIRVDQAGDGLAGAVEAVLAGAAANLVLLLADNLPAASKLRQAVEAAKDALAIPCYADAAETVDALIDDVLGAVGARVSRPARHYLQRNLGADRALSRGELEKLALYLGPQAAGHEVSLEDAEAVVADAAGLGLDAIAEAALGGDAARCDREYARALNAGVSPVAVIRAVLGRIERLHKAALMCAGGQSPRDAVAALRPPVFWKDRAGYEAQLRRWSAPLLARALDLALEAEVECKSTGIPAEAACGRALLRLARAGGRS